MAFMYPLFVKEKGSHLCTHSPDTATACRRQLRPTGGTPPALSFSGIKHKCGDGL